MERLRFLRSLPALVLVAVLCLGASALAVTRVVNTGSSHQGTIYACVGRPDHDLRLVSGPGRCLTGETPISFNEKGPRGRRGMTGKTGAASPQGLTGAKGDSGPQGGKGATGTTGDIGVTGPQGATGDIGVTGPQGATGDIGAAGPQGTKGDTGAAGADGAGGPQGAKGDAGAAGADGATGPQGLQGPAGGTGTTGSQGPAGPSVSASFVSSGSLPAGFVWTTVGQTTVTTVSGENNLVINGWTFGMNLGNPGSYGEIKCQYVVDGQADTGGQPTDSWLYGEYSEVTASAYSPVTPGTHTVQLECQERYATGVFGGKTTIIATG